MNHPSTNYTQINDESRRCQSSLLCINSIPKNTIIAKNTTFMLLYFSLPGLSVLLISRSPAIYGCMENAFPSLGAGLAHSILLKSGRRDFSG
jgi:hypothetical protein